MSTKVEVKGKKVIFTFDNEKLATEYAKTQIEIIKVFEKLSPLEREIALASIG